MNPTNRPRSGSQLSGSGIPPNANNISRTNSQVSLSGNVVGSNNRSRTNSQVSGSPQQSRSMMAASNPTNQTQSGSQRSGLPAHQPSTQGPPASATPRSTNQASGGFYVPPGGNIVNVDEKITTLEDEILKQQLAQNLPFDLSTLTISDANTQPQAQCDLPIRPAFGREGEPIELWTNHLQIHIAGAQQIYRYEVAMMPKLDTKTQARKIKRFFALLCEHRSLGGVSVATDYANFLFSTKSLGLGAQETREVDIGYVEVERPARILPYKAKIRPNKMFSLGLLLEDLSNADQTYPEKAEALQALNVLLSDALTKSPNVCQSGKSKHFPLKGLGSESWNLGGGLEARGGFFVSVRSSTGRLLLNINPTSGAFYKPGALEKLIEAFESESRTGTPQERHSKLSSFLFMVQVQTDYVKENGNPIQLVKTIRRMPLPPAGSPQATVSNLRFPFTNPQSKVTVERTVIEHFAKEYNVILKNKLGRVVDCGIQGNVWIPVELCTVRPGQTFRDTLASEQTANMIKVACKRPDVNARLITNQATQLLGIGENKQGPGPKFGINIDPNLLKILGRVIPPPTLLYGGNKKKTPSPGSWNLKEVKFHTPAQIKGWGFLVLEKPVMRPLGDKIGGPITYQTFIDGLGKMMSQYGIRPGSVPVCRMVQLSDNNGVNLKAIQSEMETAKSQAIPTEMMIVFLPNNENRLRSMVKYLGDYKVGITTICIVPKVKSPGQRFRFLDTDAQFLANIMLKVNAKMGGQNHILESRSSKLPASTMFCGIDVCHPGQDTVRDCPSIAAFVANTNSSATQWPASIRAQIGRQEIVAAPDRMLYERLSVWRAKNKNVLPQCLMIYRDGVSTSQYDAVLRQELPKIRAATQHADFSYQYTARPPRITLVVCTKRHQQRFYTARGTSSSLHDSRTGNCRAGTVIDRGVTTEKFWSFYLQPHSALQGTARSVRYDVLLNEMNLKGDDIQSMTNQLSYLFPRATKAISLCPPAFCADLAALRGSEFLFPQFHPRTRDEPPFDWNKAPWLGGVHKDIAERMFYL